jgi:hypothetical protein
MNVPAEARERALLYSADRLSGFDFAFGPRHVVVNIPSAAVEAVEDGAVARRYVAVAGNPKHPSPTVTARIGAINLNPTWTLPISIVKNEIIPKMRKDPGTLAKQRIRIFGVLVDAAQGTEPGDELWADGRKVGVITYGMFSTLTKRSMAIARLAPSHAVHGTKLEVRGRSVSASAIAHTLPFDDPEKKKRTAIGRG